MDAPPPCLPVRYADSELAARAKTGALAARHAARLGRLLDERVRTLGVDVGALAAQGAATRSAAAQAAAANRE